MPFLKILNSLRFAIVAFFFAAVIFWQLLEEDASLFECNIEVSTAAIPPDYLKNNDITDIFKEKNISHQVLNETIILKKNVNSKNECRIDFLTTIANIVKSENQQINKQIQQDIAALIEKVSTATKELEALQTQLYELKAKRQAIKEQNQRLIEQRKSFNDKISALNTQREELLLIYTSNHPDIINIEEEIALYEDKLKELPQAIKVSPDLDSKISSIQAQYSTRTNFLSSLKEELKVAKDFVQDPLKINSTEAIVISEAEPKLIKVLSFSGIAAFFIFLVSFLFDKKIYSSKYLNVFNNLKIVTEMPKIKKRTRFFSIPFDSSARGIKTSFEEISSFLKEKRVIFITSSRSKEGKTTLAINLAAFFSKEGKRTILVDFNFQNAKLTKSVLAKKEGLFINDALNEQSIEKKVFNFSHLALDKPKLEEFITKQGLDRLSVLFARPQKRGDLISYGQLIERLKSSYDYVICDCFLFCQEIVSLSQGLESDLLLVVRRARIKKGDIRRVEESLNFDKIGIKGVVFNLCT